MNNMNTLNYIFIVIILILIMLIISSYQKINYINKILDEVLEGNLNQRIRIQNHMGYLNILNIRINNLIEKLQEINERSKRSEESRKKMISNISHDLRTPLTSMLGYMELILSDNTLENNKRTEYLKIIYSKGNSLYCLMEEFFQVSKLDSNDIRLQIEEINLSEIIRQNVVSFFSEIKNLNIEPKINIPKDDVYVVGDEKALNRIFSNLINNVLKHGSQATVLGIDLSYDEKSISVDIYDNGIGIPESEINYIFDRLYTVEKTRKLNLRSSGLGLTIVKKLVRSLGGTISVLSAPFERTVFTVTLPRKSAL